MPLNPLKTPHAFLKQVKQCLIKCTKWEPCVNYMFNLELHNFMQQ